MKKSKIIFVLILLIVSALSFNFLPIPNFISTQSASQSITLLSREGVELRKTLSNSGGRRQFVSLNDVNATFLNLLVETEDRRFFLHTGFDVPAQVRAILQYVKVGRVVSGASTITMQLVRLSRPASRTLLNKFTEMAFAFYLEMSLSKEQILTQYLNHLPFGNEIYGVSEAAQVYFKKMPKDLSLVESALLIGLIRAPEAFNPLKDTGQLQAVAFRVLSQAGYDLDALNEELIETRFYRPEYRFKAPHFSDFVLKRLRGSAVNLQSTKIKTSLDLQLNDDIERFIQEQIQSLATMNVNQASVLVVQNVTGEILGYVGSKNYWDDFSQGMIDGVNQYRQPGSTIKPFTYALALDSGLSPTAMLADVQHQYESEIGDYVPMNYDRKFRGPVLMRQALANSLNVPAVEVLQKVGVPKLYGLMHELKFEGLTETPDHYGLGLTLGNVETSLLELVRAYSVFARGGQICDLTFLVQNKRYKCTDKMAATQSNSVFDDRNAALIVRHFLSDDKARRLVFGDQGPLNFDFPVMVKTGTSQNYRDNWTIAVTPKYTIGVWVGNFNGDAMQGVSGVTGAAPIANAIVNHLHQRDPWFAWADQPQLKKTKVCALSGLKPNKNCPHLVTEFTREDHAECGVHELIGIDRRTGGLASESCSSKHIMQTLKLNLPDVYHLWQLEEHPETLAPTQYSSLCERLPGSSRKDSPMAKQLRILKPQAGDVYKIDKHRPALTQVLSLKTTRPDDDLIIEMDQNFNHSKSLQTLVLTPVQASAIALRPGKHRLRVRSRTNAKLMDEVEFWVR